MSELSLADGAVKYVLDRMQTDPDLRWHLLHTEALYRLCLAEAAQTGETVGAVQDRRSRDLQPGHRKRQAALPLLRQVAERLVYAVRDVLDHTGDDRPHLKALKKAADDVERYC